MLGSVRYRAKRFAILSFAAGLLTSCTTTPITQTGASSNANPGEDRAKAPKVVVTTTVLCDLAKQIAGSSIDLTCLLKPGVDGHIYAVVPEDRRAIEDAKLILYSGYNFEPGLVKLIKATSNPAPKVAVGEVAVPQPLMSADQDQEEGTNNFKSGDQKTPDPHVWQNAENGARMVAVVQENLAKLVPEKASLYAKNAQALATEIRQIDRWIKAQIATIPIAHRKLVTTHDALGYYAIAYGIPVEGALQGISTQEKPTPTRVKELVTQIQSSGVPTIFAEVVVNPKLIETVAKEAGVKVSDQELFSDSLAEVGSAGDTYTRMLIANTKTIVQGLDGKYVEFQRK